MKMSLYVSWWLLSIPFYAPIHHCFLVQKYFGIFEDVANAKDFDWPGFMMNWLLDAIKAFNKGKFDTLKGRQSLGGCLYYLAIGMIIFLFFMLVKFLTFFLNFEWSICPFCYLKSCFFLCLTCSFLLFIYYRLYTLIMLIFAIGKFLMSFPAYLFGKMI